MNEIIFGVFVPLSAFKKKVIQEAVIEKKPVYSSETGKKLKEPRTVVVKPELLEWTFKGQTFKGANVRNGGNIYNFERDVISAYCYTVYGSKGLIYKDYSIGHTKDDIQRGFLVGFSLQNYSEYEFDSLIEMQKRLKNEFKLTGKYFLSVEIERDYS
jgi:hypothetical protein